LVVLPHFITLHEDSLSLKHVLVTPLLPTQRLAKQKRGRKTTTDKCTSM
jgi:hypothetical protein